MAGWYHRLNGHECERTLGVGDGQGGLACCDLWGRKESDTTEQLNWPDYRLTMNGQRSWRTLKLWGKWSNLGKNIWRRILCFYIELYIPLNRKCLEMLKFMYSIIVQSLSCVWLFVTPWTAACQASLPFTISYSLLKLMLLSWWCHPTISSSVALFFSCPHSSPASESFPMSWLFASGDEVLELQLHHQYFQWIFKVDFL